VVPAIVAQAEQRVPEVSGSVRGGHPVNRSEAGPIWLGYRNASPAAPSGYQVMIYEKGAWVFHMLRMLMLDLQTQKEDRFTGMMRDFYETYSRKGGDDRGLPTRRRATRRNSDGLVLRSMGQGHAHSHLHVAWTTEPTAAKYRVRFRVTAGRAAD